MDLLLDTHIFIWFLNGDQSLGSSLANKIADTSNKCYVSIASIWEIAIKVNLNKLELKGSFSDILTFMDDNDLQILPLTFEQIQLLLSLEPYHRDPFDRIIVCQAMSEKMAIATYDKLFKGYNVQIVSA